MADHAVLSASGSHRWLNCTPSARLELEFENTGSEAAREGTAAHALCEHKLKRALHMRSRHPVSDYDSDEMEECTDAYVDFVIILGTTFTHGSSMMIFLMPCRLNGSGGRRHSAETTFRRRKNPFP